MATLVKEDYEIIKQLLDVSSEIKSIYDKLIEAEIKSNKNSEDYNKLIANLNIKIEEEKKIFQEIGNNPERIQMLMEYFFERTKINNFSEDLRILTSGNDDEIIKRRILIRLLSKKLNIEKERLHEMGIQLDEDLESVSIETDSCKNYAYYGLSTLLLLSSILKEDFLKTLFMLLKKEKETINNKDFYKTSLMISFLYDFIEKMFLKNYSEDKVYWSSKLASQLKGISDEAYKNTKEIYGYELAESLFYLKNNAILNRILRVSLLFCSDEEIEILQKNRPEALSEITEYIKRDKEIPLILTLKLRRKL